MKLCFQVVFIAVRILFLLKKDHHLISFHDKMLVKLIFCLSVPRAEAVVMGASLEK